MNPSTHVVLAQDADLESLRDGAPQIYWSEPGTYQATSGARWLQTMLSVISFSDETATFSADIVAQYSFDGRSWVNFGRSLIDSSDSGGVTAIGNHQLPYAGDSNVEFAAPYVRFGVVVGGEPGSPGAQQVVRLTAVVAIMGGEDTIINRQLSGAAGYSIQPSVANELIIGSMFDATPAREGWVGVLLSSITGAVTDLKVQGSPDGTNWFDVVVIAATAANGYQAGYISSWSPRYLQVVYTGNGSAAGTVDQIDIMLRS